MIRPFARSQPLQAIKLTSILVVLIVASAGTYGVISSLGLSSLFLIVVLGFLLGLIIIGETLLSTIRAVESGESIRDQVTSRPMSVVFRTLEFASVVIPAMGLVYLINSIPEGPMAGPGAIGLLFIITGLGMMPMGGSLMRSLFEVYNFRQNGR